MTSLKALWQPWGPPCIGVDGRRPWRIPDPSPAPLRNCLVSLSVLGACRLVEDSQWVEARGVVSKFYSMTLYGALECLLHLCTSSLEADDPLLGRGLMEPTQVMLNLCLSILHLLLWLILRGELWVWAFIGVSFRIFVEFKTAESKTLILPENVLRTFYLFRFFSSSSSSPCAFETCLENLGWSFIDHASIYDFGIECSLTERVKSFFILEKCSSPTLELCLWYTAVCLRCSSLEQTCVVVACCTLTAKVVLRFFPKSLQRLVMFGLGLREDSGRTKNIVLVLCSFLYPN